jgi:hypothetical protein
MNCKPGDLAMYVGKAAHMRGRVVKCVELLGLKPATGSSELWAMWRVDPPQPDSPAHVKDWIADRALRPIRDPGEDAKDETLNWLPVPQKEIA